MVANELDSDVGVNELKLQSRNYIHFCSSTLEKVWTPLCPAKLWVK